MRSVLYFPRLSLPSASWVTPALLYFETIQVVAPHGYDRSLFDDRTNALISEGLVSPKVPHVGGDMAAQERLLGYILAKSSGTSPKAYNTFGRIHFLKFAAASLPGVLLERGLLWEADDHWLEGPTWVVNSLMAYLALRLSQQGQTSLVTDQAADWTSMTGCRATRTRARRIAAVTSLLPVSPSVSIRQLVRFRDQNRDALEAFRTAVDQIIAAEGEGLQGDFEFSAQLRTAQDVRAELMAKLAEAGWRPAAVDLGLAGLSVAASGAENAYLSAGVGLIGIVVATHHFAHRRSQALEASSNPLVYAALAGRQLRH